MSETFEAARLERVHPGPLRIPCGTSLVVIRAVERYPRGTIVTWTCSPGDGEIARLAQGTPRVGLQLTDAAGTSYAPLGESVQGGGRTLFGASFFAAAPPRDAVALELAVEVAGALGGGIATRGNGSFPLQGAS